MNAEDAAIPGFLSLLNAVTNEHPCHVWIDRKKLTSAGLSYGDSTGGILLSTGPHELKLTVKGFPVKHTKIDISAETTTSYVIFVKSAKPSRNRAPGPASLEIACVNPFLRGSHRLEVTSWLDQKIELALNGQTLVIHPNRRIAWREWQGESLELTHQKTLLAKFPKAAEGRFSLLLVPAPRTAMTAHLHEQIAYDFPSWLSPNAGGPQIPNP